MASNAQLVARLDGIRSRLAEAARELTGRIAELEAAIRAAGTSPDIDVVLASITVLAQALANIVSTNPAPPPADIFAVARTGQSFPRFAQALAAAQNGDTIKIKPGAYTVGPSSALLHTVDERGTNYGVLLAGLTVESAVPGQRAVFDLTGWAEAANRVGGAAPAFVMGKTCASLTIRGISCRGLRVASNGAVGHGSEFVNVVAGYPLPADSLGMPAALVIEDCEILEYPNGVLTLSNHNLTVAIRRTLIQDCSNSGLTHGLYIAGVKSLEVTNCVFRSTIAASPQSNVGHFLKSRANVNRIADNLFDGAHGTARAMDISNGGQFICTNNRILHYGSEIHNAENYVIGYGAEQVPQFREGSPMFNRGTNNWVDDDRGHAIVMSGNVIRKAQPTGGDVFDVLRIWPVTDNADQPMPVRADVRGNTVAGYPATKFVAGYPNNAEVDVDRITDDGRLLPPRGTVPAWVPTVAWQWTDIPGSRFNDWMKSDGTGIAPAQTVELGGHGSPFYYRQLDYSGGIWAAHRHALVFFGGGHNATSINAVSMMRFDRDAVDMVLIDRPTDYEMRLANYGIEPEYKADGRWPDGRPKAVHLYENAVVFPALDVYVTLGLTGGDAPDNQGDGAAWWESASISLSNVPAAASGWEPVGAWPMPPAVFGETAGIDALCFQSHDGRYAYWCYMDAQRRWPLQCLDSQTKTWSNVGNVWIGRYRYSRGAARHDVNEALILAGIEYYAEGNVYGARTVDLDAGVLREPQTVTGYRPSTDYRCYDLVWVKPLGAYIACYLNMVNNLDANDCQLIKLTPVDATTYHANLLTLTGAKPTRRYPQRGMYYDEEYGCLILFQDPAYLCKAVRVA